MGKPPIPPPFAQACSELKFDASRCCHSPSGAADSRPRLRPTSCFASPMTCHGRTPASTAAPRSRRRASIASPAQFRRGHPTLSVHRFDGEVPWLQLQPILLANSTGVPFERHDRILARRRNATSGFAPGVSALVSDFEFPTAEEDRVSLVTDLTSCHPTRALSADAQARSVWPAVRPVACGRPPAPRAVPCSRKPGSPAEPRSP